MVREDEGSARLEPWFDVGDHRETDRMAELVLMTLKPWLSLAKNDPASA
jgi:hypothetical protein